MRPPLRFALSRLAALGAGLAQFVGYVLVAGAAPWLLSAARARMNVWLGLACALCVLGAAESGQAYQAPMCDSDATSIAAPLPAPPSDDGTIDVAPCAPLPFILSWDDQDSDPPPKEPPNLQLESQTDLGWMTESLGVSSATSQRCQILADFGVPAEGVRFTIDKPPRG